MTDAGEKLAVHISLERPYSENDSESQLAEEESRNGFSKAGSDDGCLELDLSAASNAAKNLLYEIQKQYGKAVVDKASCIVIHLSDNKSLDVVEDRTQNTQVPILPICYLPCSHHASLIYCLKELISNQKVVFLL